MNDYSSADLGYEPGPDEDRSFVDEGRDAEFETLAALAQQGRPLRKPTPYEQRIQEFYARQESLSVPEFMRLYF